MFTVVIGVGLLEATPLGVLIALDNLDLVTDDPDFLTHVQAREPPVVVTKGCRIVSVPHAVFVRGEVAGKDQPGPGSLEPEPLVLGPHVCLDSFGHRRGHLRCHRPRPDQPVQPGLVGPGPEPVRHRLGQDPSLGRSDRLVRFLSVLLNLPEEVWLLGNVFLAKLRSSHVPQLRDSRRGHVQTVGAHVGDETFAPSPSLVERLSRGHRPRRPEPEPGAGILLQGGRGERRPRSTGHVLLDHVVHRQGRRRAQHGPRGQFRRLPRPRLHLTEPFTVEVRELPDERPPRAPVGFQAGEDVPELLLDEPLNLKLALANQAQRRALHPPGAQCPGHLPPQHRREGKSEEVIESAARQVGIHQRRADLPRRLKRLPHRLLRHLRERDPLHGEG